MTKKLDKLTRAAQFRARLAQALASTGMSQAELARRIAVDRSTVSQLLGGDGARLPNAQVVGECATALGVSADWLLSLSDRPETAADLLATSMTLTAAERALVDEQIFAWHREAEGYKIRHVPAALPDMLKTDAMLQWEYSPHLGRSTVQAIRASNARLDWMRGARSDYEIAMPMHEIESFARAEGYYRNIPAEIREAQLTRLVELTTNLFPRLRLFFFDARRLYSAPITVFGPLMAVLYAGRNYIAFRDSARVAALTEHFDQLVREARISDREVTAYLVGLRRTI
ncbi:DNA-binding protein [Oceanicola sp. 22II-s10i]|uniref:helix-turn-helix domain-containing protein n=1 Tax=Oceanicola sp. 22II-s10i TaxID=1317116 RepID=UPI000B5248FA|nr:helix-turn-helix transcriptional regulator [Oceanicola sp. 22II-s10i]OWU82887.1 DNA-binding protein [Oceanicola sp. 22II-s10i]